MKIETQRLKSFLLDAGLIDEKALAVAEKKVTKDKGLSDILVAEGKISEDDFVKLQGYILGMPFVSLENEKISDDILRVIPEPIARTHNIIAYKKTGNNLEVAMLDPGDLETIEFIKKTAIPIREVKGAGDTPEDLEKTAQELPIVRIVDTLLQHAIVERASDIHIEPMEKEVIVRYRIDGILRDAMVLPKQVAMGIIARIKVLSNLKLDEHRLPQDGRFKIETNEYKISFRVSIL